MKYYIWSNEHRSFWRPNAQGYCKLKSNAGVYDQHHAEIIVHDANFHQPDGDVPNEAMIPSDYEPDGSPNPTDGRGDS